jgi:hypothetical protein
MTNVIVPMRVLGSGLVIIAYFTILHINTTFGVALNFLGDCATLPYFVMTKSWDIVIMVSFLLVISLSKLLS